MKLKEFISYKKKCPSCNSLLGLSVHDFYKFRLLKIKSINNCLNINFDIKNDLFVSIDINNNNFLIEKYVDGSYQDSICLKHYYDNDFINKAFGFTKKCTVCSCYVYKCSFIFKTFEVEDFIEIYSNEKCAITNYLLDNKSTITLVTDSNVIKTKLDNIIKLPISNEDLEKIILYI